MLLLMTYNYNSLTDLIPSDFFLLTKSHFIFATGSTNTHLGDIIFFFITFFTLAALSFLLEFRYTFAYSYSTLPLISETLTVLLLITFFYL